MTPVIGARMTGASMVTGPTEMGLTQAHGKARLYRKGRERARRGANERISHRPDRRRRVAAAAWAAACPSSFGRSPARPVLAHAVDALASHPAIDAVRVVIGEGQEELAAACPRRPRCRAS